MITTTTMMIQVPANTTLTLKKTAVQFNVGPVDGVLEGEEDNLRCGRLVDTTCQVNTHITHIDYSQSGGNWFISTSVSSSS